MYKEVFKQILFAEMQQRKHARSSDLSSFVCEFAVSILKEEHYPLSNHVKVKLLTLFLQAYEDMQQDEFIECTKYSDFTNN